jgi:hypothetical protein
MQEFCKCFTRVKEPSEACAHHLGIQKDVEKEQSLSDKDMFTIGAMMRMICVNRLGQVDDAQGWKTLLAALLEKGVPTALADNESLLQKAYKTVGQGVGWYKENQ